MAQTAWPFGEQGVTDAQYRRYARTYAETKIHEGLVVSANSTGLQVQVSAGFAVVQGLAYYLDAQATVSIGANQTSLPRIDAVVLRLDYSATPKIQLATVQGAPNSSPQQPTLTQTDMGVFEFPLGYVTIPANAVTISSSSVSGVLSGATYRWVNGALKLWDCDSIAPLISKASGQYWNYEIRGSRLSGGIAVINMYMKKATAAWVSSAWWQQDPIFKMADAIKPAIWDQHFYVRSNSAQADGNLVGYVNNSTFYLRMIAPNTFELGAWLMVNLVYPIA